MNPWYPRHDMHTPEKLLQEHRGRSGIWIVHTAPTRDERGTTQILGCFEGPFEAVLAFARQQRSFMDEGMCGDILPLLPTRVGAVD